MSLTCGPDCSSNDNVAVNFNAPTPDVGVLAAPSAPLTFDGGTARQHRVMVSIRLR